MERALRVCRTCKARKKGCDKALPQCGYCNQRRLVCLYTFEDEPSTEARPVPSNEMFQQVIAPAISLFHPLRPFLHSSPSDLSLPFNHALYLQVSHIFHITGQSFSRVCDQYFKCYHGLLPVISRVLLDERNAMHHDSYAPTDFSLLVLAMYLVTLKPSSDTISQVISPGILYRELKVLFARAQATTYASRGLLQTSLLLASFEYACGRLYAAYMSIGTCVQMVSLLGINYDQSSTERSNGDPGQELMTLEERNIWWGVIFLERLILHEYSSGDLRPLSQLPCRETELPSDLICDNSFRQEVKAKGPTVNDIHSSAVSSFGRQVQAVYLLVEVSNFTIGNDRVQITEIGRLDDKLQEFLSILMNHPVEGHRCSANGIILRSLIRLHQYILSQKVDHAPSHSNIQNYSHSVLNTLARMMTEVVRDHLERFAPDNIDSLPLSCSHNIRSTMQLVKDRRDYLDIVNPPEEFAEFVAFYEVVCKRWPSVDDIVHN